MSATLDDVKKKTAEPSAEARAAAELVRLAKEQGLSLTGPDGLLKQFTKNVLETALNEEMTEHLGHEKIRLRPIGSRSISVTEPGRKPSLRKRLVGSRSTFPGIVTARLHRRSLRSGNGVSPVWMKSCCRYMPVSILVLSL
jgi:hypothetical protein